MTCERIAAAAIAANQPHLVALAEVERRVVGRAHAADVLERHRHLRAADVELDAAVVIGEPVGEAELEREVLLRVAVVVDVDLVQRRRVHGEIVRTAVRLLQRDVVGEQRDVAVPAGLVAVEEIEVGRIHRRHARDVRRFAVAGSQAVRLRMAAGPRPRPPPGSVSGIDMSCPLASCEALVDDTTWGIRGARGRMHAIRIAATIFFIRCIQWARGVRKVRFGPHASAGSPPPNSSRSRASSAARRCSKSTAVIAAASSASTPSTRPTTSPAASRTAWRCTSCSAPTRAVRSRPAT